MPFKARLSVPFFLNGPPPARSLSLSSRRSSPRGSRKGSQRCAYYRVRELCECVCDSGEKRGSENFAEVRTKVRERERMGCVGEIG